MRRYVLSRLSQTLVVLFGVSLLTFLLVNVAPGDPVYVMLSKKADEATIQRVREELGTDRPVVVQYIDFVFNAVQGDLGTSYFQKIPVSEIISKAWVVTAKIALVSLAVAAVVGVGVGTVCAVFRGRWVDRISMLLSMVFVSVPPFWVAIILQIIFGLTLKWLPISGQSQPCWIVMPVLCLGVSYGASASRLIRTNMIEVLGEDYIRTAKAKGLGGIIVVCKHALKNAAIPIVTVLGMQLRSLFCGALIVETVFALQGLGDVCFSAISTRDLPIIQGTVLYTAFLYVIINLLVDLLYAVLDPRIRVTSGGK